MNDTIRSQLHHRSIREFTETPLTDEQLDTLKRVANQTATSNGQQQSSILRITDSKLKEKIAAVCNQKYVGYAPELWIFLVDNYRNSRIAREADLVLDSERDMDRFMQGFTDAVLNAQNVSVAAESMGLGTVFLGSILNDAQAIVDILELPELVFPAVGLLIGNPNQEPQLKPRMPIDSRFFENHYEVPANYHEALKEYDKEMQTYYDLRNANRRVDSFTDQVVGKLQNPIEKRGRILDVVKEQGYHL